MNSVQIPPTALITIPRVLSGSEREGERVREGARAVVNRSHQLLPLSGSERHGAPKSESSVAPLTSTALLTLTSRRLVINFMRYKNCLALRADNDSDVDVDSAGAKKKEKK